ncbi:MAG: aldehyde ferredoxin oxidoreductase N-terminal domain-containing protein [bacterium]
MPGGRSPIALRMAGYGAAVIKGASDTPIYLAIHGDRVYFRDASSLWGMRSSFTVGRIIREAEPAAGLRLKKYHDLGTAENVLPLNALKGLPTRNLQGTEFEGASELSGETFAEKYLIRCQRFSAVDGSGGNLGSGCDEHRSDPGLGDGGSAARYHL